MRFFKLSIAILLLPVCCSGLSALFRTLVQVSGAEFFWVATLTGAACWMVVYLNMPKPMRLYVFGHELTHVIWIWCFGGRVKKFRANAKGGRVVTTKSNFLIQLAPYFFPIYALCVTLIFLVVGIFWTGLACRVLFHLTLGAAYAFHLTLTAHILKIRQPDIISHGYLFSGVIILLGNLLVLLVAIPLLTDQTELSSVLAWWLQDTGALFRHFFPWGR